MESAAFFRFFFYTDVTGMSTETTRGDIVCSLCYLLIPFYYIWMAPLRGVERSFFLIVLLATGHYTEMSTKTTRIFLHLTSEYSRVLYPVVWLCAWGGALLVL